MRWLIHILSIVVIFQLALLVVFLLTSSKGRRLSNYLLAAFLGLLFFNIGDGLLSYYGFYKDNPAYAHIEDGFVFLLGPALYFYTLSMVFRDFKLRGIYFIHLIPFVLISTSYLIFYHLQREEYQRLAQEAIFSQTLPPQFYVISVGIFFHLGVYLFVSFRKILIYRKEIANRFSSIRKIDLDWLTFLLGSVAALLIVSVAFTFLPVVGLSKFLNIAFALSFIVLFGFTNVVVWKGLRQPDLFSGIESEPTSGKKYSGSNLSESERKDILKNLENFMIHKKPYRNPDLSLDQLAQSLNTSSKKLSQCINEDLGQSFFDYINSHRIVEAQRILRESKDPGLTVLEVMYQSGFNSKSSFNTIFKQKTGLTPSAFKREAGKS